MQTHEHNHTYITDAHLTIILFSPAVAVARRNGFSFPPALLEPVKVNSFPEDGPGPVHPAAQH